MTAPNVKNRHILAGKHFKFLKKIHRSDLKIPHFDLSKRSEKKN